MEPDCRKLYRVFICVIELIGKRVVVNCAVRRQNPLYFIDQLSVSLQHAQRSSVILLGER